MNGYIYAIAGGGWVKIGWSANPAKRFVKIQSDNPGKCKLIGVRAGTRDDEKAVHIELNHARLTGEWFDCDDEEVASFISSLDEYEPAKKSKFGAWSNALAMFCHDNDLTASKLASMVGVSPSAVTRWIRGERRPDLESLAAIEKATKGKVGLADFLPRESEAAQ